VIGGNGMEDYAVAIVDEAENPRHVGRRFTVGY
jgi:putative NADH-flavin reductase